VLQIHSKLMTCCTMFATWVSASLSRSLASADPDLSKAGGAESSRAHDPTRLPKLEDTLKRYEDHFNRHLRILMDRYDMHLDRPLFSINIALLILGCFQLELFRRDGKCRLVKAGPCFGNGHQGRDLKGLTGHSFTNMVLVAPARTLLRR
jgi:hypothetical protein